SGPLEGGQEYGAQSPSRVAKKNFFACWLNARSWPRAGSARAGTTNSACWRRPCGRRPARFGTFTRRSSPQSADLGSHLPRGRLAARHGRSRRASVPARAAFSCRLPARAANCAWALFPVCPGIRNQLVLLVLRAVLGVVVRMQSVARLPVQ